MLDRPTDMNKQKQRARIEAEYKALASLAEAFCEELAKQLSKLVEQAGIPLAFPIQHRVKKWASLAEKFDRISLPMTSVKEVQDLIGLRLILLFRRDLSKVDALLHNALKVIRIYDTGERLKADQFGYSSRHYVLALPDGWMSVPTFAGMRDLIAEIQVRTLAQHMWAEASHVLQYKREDTVPITIRRALYRGSAILETLDLEFDRILQERDNYRDGLDVKGSSDTLNVDILEKTLDSLLPPENKDTDEPYAALLFEFEYFGIRTAVALRDLVTKHLAQVVIKERKYMQDNRDELKKGQQLIGTTIERFNLGVYFSHVGLDRGILELEYGNDAMRTLWRERESAKSKTPL